MKTTKKILIRVSLVLGVGIVIVATLIHAGLQNTDAADSTAIPVPAVNAADSNANIVSSTALTPNEAQQATAIQTAEVSSTDSRDPVHISIPAINVNAKVDEVGVTSAGAMATPNNYTDVGWYKYGTLPGDIGSAVIAGHRDNALFLPAVFYYLKDLKDGDDIYITDENGNQLHFVVTDVETYDYTDVPTDTLFNQTGSPFLKLVTCDGNWIEKVRTENKRIVVTAVLENN